MTIWCLFSIENNYDQPHNNLVSFWGRLPDIKAICKVLDKTSYSEINDNSIEAKKILEGYSVRINNCDYRLEIVNEGEILE